MKVPWVLAIMVLLTSMALAQGQGTGSGSGSGAGNKTGTVTGIVGGFISTGSSFSGMKDVPFSADVTTETDRILADGNRVHRETQGKMFRDSEGRTRTEEEFPLPATGEKLQRITIQDPAQQMFVILDPKNKIAHTYHSGRQLSSPPAAATVPKNTMTPQSNVPKFESKSEDLGTMEIDGLLATGVRHTRTTPAGVIGNEKPIVTVNETWYSPELKTVVLSKNDDPQSGQTTRKLTNIQRLEPDPLLFQVPPDYTVKDDSLPQ
jgi:hypothetical protein